MSGASRLAKFVPMERGWPGVARWGAGPAGVAELWAGRVAWGLAPEEVGWVVDELGWTETGGVVLLIFSKGASKRLN